jgi:uncharacterized protein YoxC
MWIPELGALSVMDINEIRSWAQVIIAAATLITIIWGLAKVVNVAEKKVEELDRRVTRLEESHASIENLTVQVASLAGKSDAIVAEVERVRNRLDRFLDTQSDSRHSS